MDIREERIYQDWGSIYHVPSIGEAIRAGHLYWKEQMYTRRLVILRNPPATRAEFWKFCGLFGKQFNLLQYKRMREHVEHVDVDGNMEFIGVLSLKTSRRLGRNALYWHADNADVGLPMRALRMAACEDLGDGALSWLNVEAAWKGLPEETRKLWRSRKVEQQSWYVKGTEFQIYPAVKNHPITGVESPRANDYCIAGTDRDDRWIRDVMDAEGNRLGGIEMKHLLESMEEVPGSVYTHHWMIGDIAVYDNQAFLHGRDSLRMGPQGERVLWRCNMDHDASLVLRDGRLMPSS